MPILYGADKATVREITVSRGEGDRRLDKYLMKYMNTAPHSFIYKMLRKKRIKLNGARASGNEILCDGDIITLYLSDNTISSFTVARALPKQAGDLDIVFEDDDILLLNKPAGMLVHSDTPCGSGDLASRLICYLDSIGLLSDTFTPAPSNRLDRNTSGIVACGKHPAAVRALNEAKPEKFYIAAVLGIINEADRLVGFISKDHQSNEATVNSISFPGSKQIITEFSPIGWGQGITLLRIKLVTGRTHQIRAQFMAAGFPVLGDPKYGNIQINEQFALKSQLLHAAEYKFTANEGLLEKYYSSTFYAPIPEKFTTFIKTRIEGFAN